MMQTCTTCHQKIAERKVMFCSALVSALWKAFIHAREKEINMIRISDLRLSTSEYARMNDLVRFGLAYKDNAIPNGSYGLPMRRIEDFFNNDWMVSAFYWHNPVENTNRMSEEKIRVDQVPNVKKIIEQYGEKMTQYRGLQLSLI